MELKHPDHIDLHSDNVAERWRKWKRQFQFFYDASELNLKSAKTQTAMLLHAAGPEAQDVYDTFTWEEGEDKNDYATVLKHFDNYCEPLRNVVYERYQFWKRDQKELESVDTWQATLRKMAATCEFETQEESMLRDKIVFGVRDIAVKERLLRENGLSLKRALDLCRAAESSKQRIRVMTEADSSGNVDVHPVKIQNGRLHNKAGETFSLDCGYCGGRHIKGQCPDYGKKCSKCSGYNHFAAVSRGGGCRRNQSFKPVVK